MIRKKTVLILGAGASREVGFPLGETLVNEIHSLAVGETKGRCLRSSPKDIIDSYQPNACLLWNLLNVAGEKKKDGSNYSVDDISGFAQELWEAQPPSIDDFLSHHSDKYGLIGKLCLFFVLSGYEDEKRICPQKINGAIKYPNMGWYKYLWKRLQGDVNGDFEKLKENKMSIITFNYDRSLEHYLFKAIRATYGLQGREDKVAEFFVKIPIFHVYGELGVLSWKFNHLHEYRTKADITNNFVPASLRDLFVLCGEPGKYGATDHDFGPTQIVGEKVRQDVAKSFIARARQIKTYHESSASDKYRQIFNEAERVLFLGFAYHHQNISVMGLDIGGAKGSPLSNDVEIYGTAIGMTSKEVAETKHYMASFSRPFNALAILNKWEGSEDKTPGFSRITSFLRSIAPLE